MKFKSSDFDANVFKILDRLDLKVSSNEPVGGLVPDFVVESSDGKRIIVETKIWAPNSANIKRSYKIADQYRDASKADGAFVVIPGLVKSNPARGVLRIEDLYDEVKRIIAELPPSRKRVKKPKHTIFVAMPFAGKYDDTFNACINAAKKVNAGCKRCDKEDFSGDIIRKTKEFISGASAIIVDLSESNPNVLYEAGYAEGLAKGSVLVCSTPLADLPFNVSTLKVIPYNIGQTCKLTSKLIRSLRKILPK